MIKIPVCSEPTTLSVLGDMTKIPTQYECKQYYDVPSHMLHREIDLLQLTTTAPN